MAPMTARAVAAGFLTIVAVSATLNRWREKRKEMARLKEVTVQIFFSCGLDPPSEETFKFAYPCALLPYALGIPSSQVVLVMAPTFVGNYRAGPRAARVSCNTVGNKTENVLPPGYHKYFNDIYQRAVDVTTLDDFGKPSIRIITGHGFGDKTGGYLKFQGRIVPFSRIAPASMLTVLDICSSAFAVASMTGQMPDDIRKFRTKDKKKMFAKNELPIVCDFANSVYQFRLGYDGQHLTQRQVQSIDYDERDFKGMSSEIGEAVLASLLHAIHSFHSGTGKTLDELFQDQYGRLRRQFLLPAPQDPPRPYSNLGGLQKMLEESVFPFRMDAFSCALQDRSDEWFLTGERVQFDITGEDQDFVETVIDYIVGEVIRWNKDNPSGSNEGTRYRNVADREWNTILTYLGQFAYRLRTLQLDEQNGQLAKSSDGVPIGVWASSYGRELSECRTEVENMLSRYKGIFDTSDESESVDE